MMQLTRSFTPKQYADGLESWGFLNFKGKSPLFASVFGDVFFGARNGIWFLDAFGGTLVRICRKEVDLQTLLDSPEGQEKYLLAGLVHAADVAGIRPVGDQVLDFTIDPVFGGPIEVSNLSVMDFVVKLNLAGQIRGQIRKMKPGATISHITVDGERL
ncbi:MAG: hypothetical protein LCH43_00750 [Actinobacteria bacterium]|nr:hypothetical protein [Actinomycetota bacterium]